MDLLHLQLLDQKWLWLIYCSTKNGSSLKSIWYDFFGSFIEVPARPNMPLHKFMKAAEREA